MSSIKGILRKIKKIFQLAYFRGNKYNCPFCYYTARQLKKVGYDLPVLQEKEVVGGGRRRAGCYCCGSSDRERLLYFYLRDHLKVFNATKPLRILHIAPEKNLSKILIKTPSIQYFVGDKFSEGYNYPSYVKNIDILSIPYNDGFFNLIICNHVLEHIIDDHLAIKELYRVLKYGGRAIMQVPISKNTYKTFEDNTITLSKDREKAFGQFDHVRIYGQDYISRLQFGGFSVEKIDIAKDYTEKNGLNPDEILFVGLK